MTLTAARFSETPEHPLAGARLLHVMLRVRDLDASIAFYVGLLGMRLLRRREFPDGRFTLAFLGYGAEENCTVIELTHNWGDHDYLLGSAFGHIAIGVTDVQGSVQTLMDAGVPVIRPPGPLKGDPREIIAFVTDPDGYRVELIAKAPEGRCPATQPC